MRFSPGAPRRTCFWPGRPVHWGFWEESSHRYTSERGISNTQMPEGSLRRPLWGLTENGCSKDVI